MKFPSSAALYLFLLRPSNAFLITTPRSTLLPASAARFSSTQRPISTKTDQDIATLFQGRTETKGTFWRPDKQDVERISWGKPSKKKGVGSRGVPHRLNQDERVLFDRARIKGLLEVVGSAWRAERRGAPLLNTYRSWCDACAHACIIVHKGNTGQDDAVVVDISPLRLATAEDFQMVAMACLEQQAGGVVEAQGVIHTESDADTDTEDALEEKEKDEDDSVETETEALLLDSDAWETRPIYQLPPYCIVWENLQRNEAKTLAKNMAKLCQTEDKNAKGQQKASKKPRGVKPGKNRRHGGYGIG